VPPGHHPLPVVPGGVGLGVLQQTCLHDNVRPPQSMSLGGRLAATAHVVCIMSTVHLGQCQLLCRRLLSSLPSCLKDRDQGFTPEVPERVYLRVGN
jgi:hypothetical protein